MNEFISNMKNWEAPGIENITTELIKNGGPELLQKIFDLLLQIWDQGIMPEEWEIGIICPIFKKAERRECSNCRGINLLNTTYKISTCLKYNRLEKYSELTLGEYQAGFRSSRLTIGPTM
jgi:hypothetical protein